jgi:6-phosphogluconolactonase (cycloisomerase 2 family)
MTTVYSSFIGSNKRLPGLTRPSVGTRFERPRLIVGLLVLITSCFVGQAFAQSAGELTFVEVQEAGVGGVTGLYQPSAVVVSPDGKNVYAAGLSAVLSSAGSVVTFSRDATTGALTFVDSLVHGDPDPIALFGGAEGIAISPDGKFVYTASFSTGAVGIFSRSESTGELSYVGFTLSPSAIALAVSPDGSHLYVAGLTRDNITVFSRDAVTGALTFVEAHKDGENGVDGLNGARSVAVSADGLDVYVGSVEDKALAVFRRNAGTGELTFVEFEAVGAQGISASDVFALVSPDGGNVYLAVDYDNAVFVFDRDASTGEITLLETQQDGINGVEGLSGAEALAITSDGKHVYAGGFVDDAVALFSRNASTGALTFVAVKQDGVDGVDGLNGATWIAGSADDASLYISGFADNAVAVFSISQGISPAAIIIPAITPILFED